MIVCNAIFKLNFDAYNAQKQLKFARFNSSTICREKDSFP